MRALGPDRASDLGARARAGRPADLRRTASRARTSPPPSPRRPTAERAAILREAWDNLGRTACEYVHSDRIWDFDPEQPEPGPHPRSAEDASRAIVALREDGKPAIFFAAHLANWELPAVAAAKARAAPRAVLYRTPNNPAIARDIVRDAPGHDGRADRRRHRPRPSA